MSWEPGDRNHHDDSYMVDLRHLPRCEDIPLPDWWYVEDALPYPLEDVTAVAVGIMEVRAPGGRRYRLEPATMLICREGHGHTMSVRRARTG